MKASNSLLRSCLTGLMILCHVFVYSQENKDIADILFHNGTVITMEDGKPLVEAIAIKGNLILAIGSSQEILEMQGDGTWVVDLQGKTLMPGIVDPHSHLFFGSEIKYGYTFDQSQQWALENGITTIGQAAVSELRYERMQDYYDEGKMIIKSNMYLGYTTNCGEIINDFWKDVPRTDNWGEKLRVGGVKIFTDGGSCGAPAVSFEYQTGGYGDLFFTQEELNTMISDVDDAGHQVIIHAQGDRAMEQCLNAIEYVLDGQPNTLRHRIDHNSYVRPDLRPRYSEIGVAPVIFAEFFTCEEQGIIDYIGTDPLPWFENWRALLEDNPGLPISWHSDTPWLELNPFYNMYCYVTRKAIDDDGVTICEPSDWSLAHTISIEQVLPLMTTGAAYALFREDEVGSLKPGKLADLIIITGNPLNIDPDSLAWIETLMTMVEGQVVYCRPGYENYCPCHLGVPEWSVASRQSSVTLYPNPTSGSSRFAVRLPNGQAGSSRSEHITIKIYDLHGREVATVADREFPPGEHVVEFDAGELPAGMYLCKLAVGQLDSWQVGKLVVID